MTAMPRGESSEINQVPPQESAENFSLSKLLECVNELADRDYEFLETLIQDGTIKAGVAAKVRKATEALLDIKNAADKIGTLKKYIPNLVDFIYARCKVDDLIGEKGVNPKLSSAIYNLVDAVYKVASDDVRASANEAILKTVDENFSVDE